MDGQTDRIAISISHVSILTRIKKLFTLVNICGHNTVAKVSEISYISVCLVEVCNISVYVRLKFATVVCMFG